MPSVVHRTYTVEWTGTSSDNTFEIDLYYCGSMCSDVSKTIFGTDAGL